METWENIQMPLKEDRLWELYHENSKTSHYVRYRDPRKEDMQTEDLHRSLPVHSIREISLLSVAETRAGARSQEISSGTLGSVLVHAWEALHSGHRIDFLSPLEFYIIISDVNGLTPGLYHMDKDAHVLRLMSETVDKGRLTECIPDYGSGRAHLCITALFQRSALRFGEKGYRLAVSESGRMAQAVISEGMAQGVDVSILHDYYERALEELIGIDGVEHAVLQIMEFQ